MALVRPSSTFQHSRVTPVRLPRSLGDCPLKATTCREDPVSSLVHFHDCCKLNHDLNEEIDVTSPKVSPHLSMVWTALTSLPKIDATLHRATLTSPFPSTRLGAAACKQGSGWSAAAGAECAGPQSHVELCLGPLVHSNFRFCFRFSRQIST